MPRNGSGTFSITNSFSSGTTISSSAMNANFSDVGAEITGSLPRDGQAAMTGQLKATSGTVGAPGVSFSSDTDTGLYLKSANTIGVVAAGAEVGTIGTTGFVDANGAHIGGFASGTVMIFAQTAAPTGWTKSTSHNDKAIRVVSGTASSGGTTAFSSVFAARTIAEANLPAHTHAVGTLATSSSGSHTHTLSSATKGGTTGYVVNGGNAITLPGLSTDIVIDSGGAHTHTITGATASTGSGTSMDFAVQYVDVIIATKD